MVATPRRLKANRRMVLRKNPAESGLRNNPVSAERRCEHRYQIPVQVGLRWKNRRSHWQYGEGQGRNVSEQGAFVVADKCPVVGTQLRIEVQFPPLMAGYPPIHATAQARVLRIESDPETGRTNGFAVKVKKVTWRFRPAWPEGGPVRSAATRSILNERNHLPTRSPKGSHRSS